MGLFASLVSAAPAIGALGNVISGFMGYRAADQQSSAQRAWQAYNNTMARLSGAQNQNAITSNEITQSQQLATQGIQMQQKDTLDAAKAEVSAAAAGVAGNSVDQTINSVHAEAANAERQREIQLSGVYASADQASINNSTQVIDHQDNSFIPKAKLGNFLLGAGLNNLKQFPTIFGMFDPKASNAAPERNTNQVLSDSYNPADANNSYYGINR